MASKKPSGKVIYLCGLGATLVVYAIYYLRNPKVLADVFRPLTGAEIALTVAAGLVVTFFGGFWSLLNKPGDYRRAFVVGLGWPAIIFAIDLGSALEPPESPARAQGFLASGFLARMAGSDSPLMRGLRLGLAPVSAVAEHRSRQAKLERAAAEEARDDALREMDRLEGDLADLEREKRLLDDRYAKQKRSIEEFEGRIRSQQESIAEQRSRIGKDEEKAVRLQEALAKASSFEDDIRRLWPETRDGWVRAMERRDPDLQRAALRVIEAVKPLSSDPAVRVLRRLVNTLEDPELRQEAARVLAAIGTE